MGNLLLCKNDSDSFGLVQAFSEPLVWENLTISSSGLNLNQDVKLAIEETIVNVPKKTMIILGTKAMNKENRLQWFQLSDDELLRQCDVDTYRASGPGGQKRNKTSSAVRLRHHPSGLSVIAEESRSQHENRAKALRRLREAFFLKLRFSPPEVVKEPTDLKMGRKDARFWPRVGEVLDVLDAMEARVSTVAEHFGVTTGNLLTFLGKEPKVWEQVAHLRVKHGQKPLKKS